MAYNFTAIEKKWQSHGVGSALLERTILAARNRGIKLLHMTCLANNRRMQKLARKFDADLTFDFGGVIGEVIHIKESAKGDGSPAASLEDRITIKSGDSRLLIERGKIARIIKRETQLAAEG